MPLLGLATELLLQILFSCNSVPDVLALASTCHRLRRILYSNRLPILFRAAEAQLGQFTQKYCLSLKPTFALCCVAHR